MLTWPFRPRLLKTSGNVVFFSADSRYLQLAWLAACAAAALAGRNYDVVLLVLNDGRTKMPAAPPGCQIIEITLPAWLGRWPVPAHMSHANYIRLFAADRWLYRWQRAVYLDSDILLHGSLAPLFELDLGDNIAAMVEDCGFCRRDEEQTLSRAVMLRAIGLDPAKTYFNTGVTLFDVARWRAAGIVRQLAGFKNIQAQHSASVDQDFINWVLRGNILPLSPRWNFQTHYFGLGLEPLVAPRITHYLDILKPWRDPEWALAYDTTHSQAYAAHLALDSVFGPGAGAHLSRRTYPDEVFKTHVAHVLAERDRARALVYSRFKAQAAGYADLTSAEQILWAAA